MKDILADQRLLQSLKTAKKDNQKRGNIKLSLNFNIAETDSFSRSSTQPEYKKVYEKIKNYVYPQLKLDPLD